VCEVVESGAGAGAGQAAGLHSTDVFVTERGILNMRTFVIAIYNYGRVFWWLYFNRPWKRSKSKSHHN
jgi:hypothetical protein